MESFGPTRPIVICSPFGTFITEYYCCKQNEDLNVKSDLSHLYRVETG